MRRTVVAGAVGLIGALGLAGCGSNSESFGVGYSIGQSLAAAHPGLSASHRTIVAACERQWRISGSNIDSQRQWVNGCIRGFLRVEAEVSNTASR